MRLSNMLRVCAGLFSFAFASIAALPAFAQSLTSFTYQGQLDSAGTPVNGATDLRFRLYDAASAGNQIGTQFLAPGTTLTNGRFTTLLDFGTAFDAAQPCWLEIDLRSPTGAGSYTTLSPRQRLSAAPLAQAIVGVPISRAGPQAVDQDQSQTPNGMASNVDFFAPCWQSFTAGKTGSIDQVHLWSAEPGPNLLTVKVHQGLGISGPAIASATVPTVYGVVVVPFSNLIVAAGSIYTLEFSGNVILEESTVAIAGAVGSLDQSSRNWRFRTVVTPLTTMQTTVTHSLVASTAYVVPWSGVSGVPANVALAPWSAATGGIHYSGGRVGIGTSAPAVPVHLSTAAVGTGWQIQLRNSSSAPTFETGMRTSDAGFFEITNRINGFTRFARLDGTGAWTAVSDMRLKTDISPLQSSLSAAMQMHPVQFKWRGENPDAPTDFGFLAQELREVTPQLVVGDAADGPLTVNYAKLSVVAIGAIQELKAESDRKQREIDELKQRLDRLEKALAGQR